MHQKQTYAHVTKAVSFITIVWVTCGSVVIVDALGVAGWWTTIGGSEEVHDSAGCFGGVRSSDSPHGTEVWGSGVHAISNTQVLVEAPLAHRCPQSHYPSRNRSRPRTTPQRPRRPFRRP